MLYNNCTVTKPYSFDNYREVDDSKLIHRLERYINEFLYKYTSEDFDSIHSNKNGYISNMKSMESYDLTIMAEKEITELVDPFSVANRTLDEIAAFSYDWNGNGAEAFSESLIRKTRKILKELASEPFVCPTACGAIQMEYEKETGEYLEFGVYEDRVEIFSIDINGKEIEETLCGIEAVNRMKQMVVNFNE